MLHNGAGRLISCALKMHSSAFWCFHANDSEQAIIQQLLFDKGTVAGGSNSSRILSVLCYWKGNQIARSNAVGEEYLEQKEVKEVVEKY